MRVPLPLTIAASHLLYRMLCGSLRFHEKNRHWLDELDARGERLVFCLWHDEMVPLMRMQKQLDIVTVVSPSRDGALLAGVLEKLGLRTVRGSSTRGGAKALLGAARLMRNEGVHACITVDGPAGPRHKAKDGAFFLARHADAYIAPVRLLMRPALRIPSWDRLQIPLPFGRVTVLHGKPWKPDNPEMTPESLAADRARLEADLGVLAPCDDGGQTGERA